jgi:electron transport complex protein RnfC
MMGFSLDTDVMPVTKGSNCLLAGTTSLFPRPQPALPCIRCSACSDACPASLLPQQLYWYARADDLEQTEDHQVFDCIECGICAEVCPSHIPLVDYFRYAKDAIRRRDEDRRKAELARQRYEARKERLAREEAEKRARREAKKAALKQGSSKTPGHDERKQAVQDALARARQRKRGGGDGNGSEGAD